MARTIGLQALCCLLGLMVVSTAARCQLPPLSLAPLFQDNMVLQRESTVPVWGSAAPGGEVSVRASWGDTAATFVQPDGNWMLKLRTRSAGGPYTLEARHGATSTVLSNVLLGEVWLCSGQSNMAMPMMGWPPADTIEQGSAEINAAHYPAIRLCTIRRTYSAAPQSACEATWTECSPSTVPEFSATAFFFGKMLHEALGVPVGLIHASWGGTPAEAWVSADFLSRLPEFSATLQQLPECASAEGRILEWLNAYPRIDVQARPAGVRWRDLECADSACAGRSYDDSAWAVMQLPTLWERTGVGDFDGVIWFRKRVTIPAGWVGKDLVLELGPIDDMDVAYVNGARVGGFEEEGYHARKRVYPVPGTIVDSVVVSIAVRVIDIRSGGGIYGDTASMLLRPAQGESSLPLAGNWSYAPVAEWFGDSLYVFGPAGNPYTTRPRMPVRFSATTATVLYNGMIAPLVPFAVRGAIWYQGESNAQRPQQYRTLFPLLIENWRADFVSGDFPFYYVQIAPFEYGTATQSQYLREAQTATLSVPHTGMAVTLDIGNPNNIHPANKRDVGRRLALWALAKTYGKRVAYSGPIYRLMRKQRRSLELFFDHAETGLVLKRANGETGFQIAGPDRVFMDAVVKVRGKTLLVSHPRIAAPAAVRYAFSNTPQATLFNKAGLPAPSFRTDDWE